MGLIQTKDVQPVEMQEVHEASTNLFAIGYDAGAQKMHVRFLTWIKPSAPGGPRQASPGKLYVYHGVPSDEYDAIKGLADRNKALLADGKGAERSLTGFFNERIKGDSRAPLFAYDQVVEEERGPG